MILELLVPKKPENLGFKRQVFWSREAPKSHLLKEKERRKRKCEEKERGRREKTNDCTLSFYNGYSVEFFSRKKKCLTEKVHLAVTFSKSRLEDFEKLINEQYRCQMA